MQKEHFLGQFKQEKYIIKKQYLPSKLTNLRLYHTKFTPPNPKKTIAVIHGFGQHSGRFSQIAHYFAIQEYEVLLIDLTGFGYSGGPRGCGTVQVLQNDVITLLSEANPNLPLYFYAHSMGGLVVIKLLLDRPQLKISGCIITSPLLCMPTDRYISPIKLYVVKEIGHELEQIILNSMINPTALTKNNKFMHNIFEDRLMIPFIGVKMARSLFLCLEWVRKQWSNFRFPIIIFHGKKDSVVSFSQGSKKFIESKNGPYRQLYLFDNGYHELHHDLQKDQLLERGLNFLQSLPEHLKKPVGLINYNDYEIPARKEPNKLKKGISFIVIIGLIIFAIRMLRKLKK